MLTNLLFFVKLLPKSLYRRLPKKVEVVRVNIEQSKGLNRQFLKRNSPANVLSFRYGKDYGEILVCPAVIRREAKKQGNTYKYQFTWMVLHGILHLVGIHHENSRAVAKKIERLEYKILGDLIAKNPKLKSQSAKPQLKAKNF